MASKEPKLDNCEWEGEKPCLRRREVETPWSGMLSNRTEAPGLCIWHARKYAHRLLEGPLGTHGKWAFDIVVREIAEEVYHEQHREEECDG